MNKSGMTPKVSIIILNWNGWKDTIECLESLYQITYPNYNVIVVDNDSKDESIKRIKEYSEGKIKVKSTFFDYSSENKPIKCIEYAREEASVGKEKEIGNLPSKKKLILIKNENNYGFAEGNNIGIRYALKALNPDYLLLLNNDTVVDKDFLWELVEVEGGNDLIGIVGPKIYYYDFDGRSDIINFTGADLILWKGTEIRYGANEIDRGQWDTHRKVDRIEGSCMLIKKEVFSKVGLLDPKYFLYWEDTDFCIRVREAGYTVVCVPRAKIWHKEATSTGGIMSIPYIYYMTRNRFLFLKKNATKLQLLSFLLYFFGYRFWITSRIFVIDQRDVKRFISFLKGVFDGLIQ